MERRIFSSYMERSCFTERALAGGQDSLYLLTIIPCRWLDIYILLPSLFLFDMSSLPGSHVAHVKDWAVNAAVQELWHGI